MSVCILIAAKAAEKHLLGSYSRSVCELHRLAPSERVHPCASLGQQIQLRMLH